MNVPAEMKNVDWGLLRWQHLQLTNIIVSGKISESRSRALMGIRTLVEHVQDEAALVLGEKAVFDAPMKMREE